MVVFEVSSETYFVQSFLGLDVGWGGEEMGWGVVVLGRVEVKLGESWGLIAITNSIMENLTSRCEN